MVVLDDMTSKTLFKGADPIGKVIQIDKMGYTVVGLYKGNNYSYTPRIYSPISTVFQIYMANKRDVGICRSPSRTSGRTNRAKTSKTGFTPAWERRIPFRRTTKAPCTSGTSWRTTNRADDLQRYRAVHLDHRDRHADRRHRRRQQHHAGDRPRANVRIRHPQGDGSQALVAGQVGADRIGTDYRRIRLYPA